MIPLKAFQNRVNEWLQSPEPLKLFGVMKRKMRQILDLPEYIRYMLDAFAEPRPLHAAVAVGYFGQHGCLPDELPAFRDKLKERCVQRFLAETASPQPNERHCAELLSAFRYLADENGEVAIQNALERLSEKQRNAVFQEIGRCIQAVDMGVSEDERRLLDPFLKYLSENYPEQINDAFLQQNRDYWSVEQQSTARPVFPKKETVSAMLTAALEKQYFRYFRLVYAMFPEWHINQTDFTAESFLTLAQHYTDSAEHYIDMAFVSMQLAKEGHTYWKLEKLSQWYEKARSFDTYGAGNVLSYLYYSVCIQKELMSVHSAVQAMPYFALDNLFEYVLIGETEMIGARFVQKDIEMILEKDGTLLHSYLEKLGNNNLWHFDTEKECPDAVPSRLYNYEKTVQMLVNKYDPETVLLYYFNTHLRKVYSIYDLWNLYSSPYSFLDDKKYVFDVTLHKYQIRGRIILSDDHENKSVFHTSQLLPNDIHIILSNEPEWISDTSKAAPYVMDIVIHKNLREFIKVFPSQYIELWSGGANGVNILHPEIRLSLCTDDEISKFTTPFINLMNKIIEMKRITTEIDDEIQALQSQLSNLETDFSFICPQTLGCFVKALETLSSPYRAYLMSCFNFGDSDIDYFDYDEELLNELYAFKLIESHVLQQKAKSEWENVKGRIREENGIKRFYPEKTSLGKYPIIITNDTNIYIGKAEITTEHTVFFIQKLEFDYKKGKFFFDTVYTEEWAYQQERLMKKLNLLSAKICTDHSCFIEMQDTIQEYKSQPFIHSRWGCMISDSQILNTIQNRLEVNCPEQILPYLQLIEPLYTHIHDCYESEQFIPLFEVIFQKCDPETIAIIYISSILSSQIRLNLWLTYAAKNDVLAGFLEAMSDYSFHFKKYVTDFKAPSWIHFGSKDFLGKKESNNKFNGFLVGEYRIENADPDMEECSCRLIGYDAEQDIVIFQFVGKEG